MQIGGISFFHPDRCAAAPDISGDRKDILNRQEVKRLFLHDTGSLFQVQLFAYGQSKYIISAVLALCDQRFEGALRRLAQLVGHR